MSDIQQVVTEFFPEAKVLACGLQGAVYVLNEVTVIKAMSECLYWEIADGNWEPVEKLAMVWANKTNNLVIEYKDHIEVEGMGELITSERIYPCLVTAFTEEQIEAAIVVAEEQLEELWASGWAHCDLRRPEFVLKAYGTDQEDILYNNIALTEVDGECIIRLIDVGAANLEQYDIDDLIDDHLAKDRADWEKFKHWILSYSRKH